MDTNPPLTSFSVSSSRVEQLERIRDGCGLWCSHFKTMGSGISTNKRRVSIETQTSMTLRLAAGYVQATCRAQEPPEITIDRKEKITKSKRMFTVRNSPLRASVLLMAELIGDTLPAIRSSYMVDEPSYADIEIGINEVKLLKEPKNFSDLHKIIHEQLALEEPTQNSFVTVDLLCQHEFLYEKLNLLVNHGSQKANFNDEVNKFVDKYQGKGILPTDCKYLLLLLFFFCFSAHNSICYCLDGTVGKALIKAIEQVLQSSSKPLWSKLYSRLARCLVPAIIIARGAAALQDSPTHAAHPAGDNNIEFPSSKLAAHSSGDNNIEVPCTPQSSFIDLAVVEDDQMSDGVQVLIVSNLA